MIFGEGGREKEERQKKINYRPFCKELKINFRGHLSHSQMRREMHAGMWSEAFMAQD